MIDIPVLTRIQVTSELHIYIYIYTWGWEGEKHRVSSVFLQDNYIKYISVW